MKNELIHKSVFLFVLLFSIISQSPILAQKCNARQIAKSVKTHIPPPFKYDGYVINDFDFQKDKLIEVQFIAFRGINYKLVFCSSVFDEDIMVNIFDKPKTTKIRKQVYDTSEGIENNYWVFEPPKSGKYYIEYTISKSNKDISKNGCMVMAIGYNDKPEPEPKQ